MRAYESGQVFGDEKRKAERRDSSNCTSHPRSVLGDEEGSATAHAIRKILSSTAVDKRVMSAESEPWNRPDDATKPGVKWIKDGPTASFPALSQG